MRDPERIDLVLGALGSLWRRHPDLRFFQVLALTGLCDPLCECEYLDQTYTEDDVLLDRLSAMRWEEK